MSDLISRKYLFKKIAELEYDVRKTIVHLPKGSPEYLRCHSRLNELNEFKSEVRDAPTVESKEVVHGEWIVGSKPRCSVCGKSALREYDRDDWLSYVTSDFCPHCGCKMKG